MRSIRSRVAAVALTGAVAALAAAPAMAGAATVSGCHFQPALCSLAAVWQPTNPGIAVSLNPQPLPPMPGLWVMLNPQPIPPGR